MSVLLEGWLPGCSGRVMEGCRVLESKDRSSVPSG